MTDWTAEIEATTATALDAKQLEGVGSRIDGTVLFDADGNRLKATLGVEAGTLRQAADRSLRAVADAARESGVSASLRSVSVTETARWMEAVRRPPGADLVGLSEAAEMLGVSRQRIGQLAEQHADFPPPIARLAAGPVFTRSSVEEFVKRWPRKPTGRPKKTG